MVPESKITADQYDLKVETAPAELDAGAEFSLICWVNLPPGSDPSGFFVSIRNYDNEELSFAELARSYDETCFTDEILLTAPLTEGLRTCRAVLVAGRSAGTGHDLISIEFSFVVRAHTLRMNVWDLPTAIVAGEPFSLKAGIKCSAGCGLAGREVTICDAEGVQFGGGKLRDEVWPDTSALYFAEVKGNAPLTLGNHRWEIRISASGSGIPHAAGVHVFDAKVVDPPDCEVTIESIDAGSQSPIVGARVVMHPYRALTDANGLAKLRVVKGDYKLLVSASKYMATAQTIKVSDDVTVQAELALEPIVDPVSYYTT
jgi:hypothetical protein